MAFNYKSVVVKADDSTKYIGRLVNDREVLSVTSTNSTDGLCATAEVSNWHNFGITDSFFKIRTQSVHRAPSGFVADEHQIVLVYSSGAWVEKEVGKLTTDDYLGCAGKKVFNPIQWQIALGSTLGDGSLTRRTPSTTFIRFAHGLKQVDYCRWKAALFPGNIGWSGFVGNLWGAHTKPSTDLNILREESYRKDGSRKLSATLCREFSPLALAVWFLDDGTFEDMGMNNKGRATISIKSYNQEDRGKLADLVYSTCGAQPTLLSAGVLSMTGKRVQKLMEAICEFVPPCMEYKLHQLYRGRYKPEKFVCEPRNDRFLWPVKIKSICKAENLKSRTRYGLSLKGADFFLANDLACRAEVGD